MIIILGSAYGILISSREDRKVARTGFEPVVSALRGRRPKPLDERAYILFYKILLKIYQQSQNSKLNQSNVA